MPEPMSIPPPRPEKEKSPQKSGARPFQELRFTRSRQAVTFTTLGVIFLSVTVALGVLFWWQVTGWMRWLWLLLPLAAAVGCFRIAAHLTKHAFLLLSPIGLEVFPFFRPAQQMQLFSWGEIARIEVTEGDLLLILTLAGYEDSKVIIGLDPIPIRLRPLLRKAAEGIEEKRAAAGDAAGSADTAAKSGRLV